MRRLIATLVVGGMLVLGAVPAGANPNSNGTFCDSAGREASNFIVFDGNGAAIWVSIVQASGAGLSTAAPPTPAADGVTCKPD